MTRQQTHYRSTNLLQLVSILDNPTIVHNRTRNISLRRCILELHENHLQTLEVSHRYVEFFSQTLLVVSCPCPQPICLFSTAFYGNIIFKRSLNIVSLPRAISRVVLKRSPSSLIFLLLVVCVSKRLHVLPIVLSSSYIFVVTRFSPQSTLLFFAIVPVITFLQLTFFFFSTTSSSSFSTTLTTTLSVSSSSSQPYTTSSLSLPPQPTLI